uniref:Uncharacterized protein n=1 Tax=Arundo donax TaxID=35708 RepID=A0A0A9FNX4_ARUDO
MESLFSSISSVAEESKDERLETAAKEPWCIRPEAWALSPSRCPR